MRAQRWRSAAASVLIAGGIGAAVAAPSAASSQRPRPAERTRNWHGIRIRPLDPVPAQFARARAAWLRSEDAAQGLEHAASAARSILTLEGDHSDAARGHSIPNLPTQTLPTPITIPTSPPPTTTTKTTPTKTTPTPPPKRKPKPTITKLSNEQTFSRWAYTNAIVWIRRRPSIHARGIVKTHWYTSDGFPEVYLALRQEKTVSGSVWIQIRIPRRPNGEIGWVPSDALGRLHLTHELIVVNRKLLRLTLYDRGRKVGSVAVGVGKPSTPTPPGRFWIRERFVITDSKSGYYPYAFGTADYSTLTDWPGGGVVGIHGPYYDPSGIPGHISHGCIRLEVAADRWLAHHIGLGVPVHVI